MQKNGLTETIHILLICGQLENEDLEAKTTENTLSMPVTGGLNKAQQVLHLKCGMVMLRLMQMLKHKDKLLKFLLHLTILILSSKLPVERHHQPQAPLIMAVNVFLPIMPTAYADLPAKD